VFCLVSILQAGTNNVLFAVLLVLGVALLVGFFFYTAPGARREGAASTGLFKTACAPRSHSEHAVVLLGVSFVVSVFLQEVRGYSAIGTGRLHRRTVCILVSSFAAARLAKKYCSGR
jgi:hypothetical protein